MSETSAVKRTAGELSSYDPRRLWQESTTREKVVAGVVLAALITAIVLLALYAKGSSTREAKQGVSNGASTEQELTPAPRGLHAAASEPSRPKSWSEFTAEDKEALLAVVGLVVCLVVLLIMAISSNGRCFDTPR